MATVAQFVFGFAWYGIIANKPYLRSIAVDKGVKAAGYIRRIHAMWQCMLSSIVAGVFRAAAVLAIVHHVSLQTKAPCTLCMYSQAGAAVFILNFVQVFEEHSYSQRPWTLIVVNAGYRLGTALVAALAVYFAKSS